MATREINDAVTKLKFAYLESVKEWDKLYPTLPKPFLTCVFRSREEQEVLYAQGRTKPGAKVTWTLNSKHNKVPSEAIDICFRNPDRSANWSPDLFKKFAAIIKKHGINWGGDFKTTKDFPHFEV